MDSTGRAVCSPRRPIFLSFLTDYATQTRFLIILPVLILAEPTSCVQRLTFVALDSNRSGAPRAVARISGAMGFLRQTSTTPTLSRISIVILTYATAAFLSQYLSPTGSEFVSWWRGGGGFKSFSLAGTWGFFVSYPILVYFTYLWIWRHLLWARFLRSTTQLKLRLVAAHPDHVGGMGFLEASLLGQIPFSFCLGVGLAGAIALIG